VSDAELKSRVISLHETLRKLEELKETTLNEFLSNYVVSDAVLHNLQLAIEALTDIGNYALRRGGHRIPETRANVFELLCSEGYLVEKSRDELVKMARFRNLVVHGYADVDLETVFDILQKQTPFLQDVASRLVQCIENRQKEKK